MQENPQERILRIAYLVLGLVAVILILIVLALKGSLFEADTWEAVALNVATELIGVVIVFVLLNKLLIGDEIRLSDRIQELVAKLDAQSKHPPATSYILKNPSMKSYFDSAQAVDMMGVALTTTAGEHYSAIQAGLRQGKTYRVILADPNGTGIETAAARSPIFSSKDFQVKIETTVKTLQELNQEAITSGSSGKVEVRKLKFAIPFGMKAFDTKGETGRIFIEVFPYQTAPEPFLEFVRGRDSEWYDFYVEQFRRIWDASAPV